MRRTLPRAWDLVAAAALLVLLDALVLLRVEGPLRVLVGAPAVLFAPGWLVVSALFPRRLRVEEVRVGEPGADVARRRERGAGSMERVALGVATSLALLVLLGLGLAVSPWRLRLAPALVALTVLSLGLAAFAAWRRARTAPQDRYEPGLVGLGDARVAWKSRAPVERVLGLAVALAVLAAAFSLAYALTHEREPERFTSLTLLGPDGRLGTLPATLSQGAEGRVRLEVENHEGERVTYQIRAVAQRGQASNATGFVPQSEPVTLRAWEVTLEDGAAWSENVTFALSGPGVHRVAFELEKPGGEPQPYRRVHLFVTVRG